jgi:polysaccharide deacetylase family protein (PEP-CTERM system associated)
LSDLKKAAPSRNGDGPGRSVLNALTVDVEDYFHASAFEQSVARDSWDRLESRVVRNTERLLDIFAERGIKGTFFVLGWVAERFPDLTRAIDRDGHEIASHGYAHQLVHATSPAAFREDLRRSRLALESVIGKPVLGYRAPSFSITARSMWALDVLIDEGYFYDASIYPIRHDRYGIPGYRRHIHRVERAGGSIWELPGSTIRLHTMNLPVGGGGYFRVLPYKWTAEGISRLNRHERQPAIFYIHPWEIDPEQPRMAGSFISRFRHYRNLQKTEPRLQQLLSEFRFGTVSDVLATVTGQPALASLPTRQILSPAQFGQQTM